MPRSALVGSVNFITFLTGMDVYLPASPDADGVIRITEVTRGGSTAEINVPSWPSSEHRISVQFRDHEYVTEAFPPRNRR